MVGKVTRISIEGFRSIRDSSVELGDINVLIGPNGIGKSNFLSVFPFIRDVASGERQQSGQSVSSPFYDGPGSTGRLSVTVEFGDEVYSFSSEMGEGGRVHILEENRPGTEDIDRMGSWRVYNFYDMSDDAPVRCACRVGDNSGLNRDAGNLAAFLLMLKSEYPKNYSRIASTVGMAIQSFEDFVLIPEEQTGEIVLRWKRKGADSI